MKKKSYLQIQMECEISNLLKLDSSERKSRLKKLYSRLEDDEKLMLFEKLVASVDFQLFSLATLFIKNASFYDLDYFDFFEEILYKYIDVWGKCDQYCYRILNPYIEKYPQLYKNVLKWAKTSQTYVKRAAAVSLIHSSQEFSVIVDFDVVKEVCKILLNDDHIHIKKAIGWLLKYSYITYPKQTIAFLNTYIKEVSSITFNYALEKMPVEVKTKMRENKKASKPIK